MSLRAGRLSRKWVGIRCLFVCKLSSVSLRKPYQLLGLDSADTAVFDSLWNLQRHFDRDLQARCRD